MWDSKLRTDSIAAWVNDSVVHDSSSEAKTKIGSDRNEWLEETYNPHISTLFGSYYHYCRISGLQAKSKNNFSADLIELCQQTLKWSDVEYDRRREGRSIRGLRLRTDRDTSPTLDDVLSNNTCDNPGDDLCDNLGDNPKPFGSQSCDNHNILLPSKISGSESKLDPVQLPLLGSESELNQTQSLNSESLGEVSASQVVTEPQTHVGSVSEVVTDVVTDVVTNLEQKPTSAITPTKFNIGNPVDHADQFFNGESVEVFYFEKWLPAIILQYPNNHPDPKQRVISWKVRFSTGQETYIWNEKDFRPVRCAVESQQQAITNTQTEPDHAL